MQMESNNLYQRLVNLWDTPRRRTNYVLSQLQPLPKTVEGNGYYLSFLNESTSEQIFTTKLSANESEDTDSSDSSVEFDHLSSSSDDEYSSHCDDKDIVNVMRFLILSVECKDGPPDAADEILICRHQVNFLSQKIMELKHSSSEFENKLTIEKILYKKRVQHRLISQLSRLVGAMTRMSLKDSSKMLTIDDNELVQIPYQCSRKDRHERIQKRQHHHDFRRRRERERRRRRKRRHHQKRMKEVRKEERSKDPDDIRSSDESERERVSQRRRRWQEMEARGNERDKLLEENEDSKTETLEPIIPSATTVASQLAVIHRMTAGQSRLSNVSAKQESHRPLKTKPKISISLNLSSISAVSSNAVDDTQTQSNENSTEISNMYSSVKFPYPVINDQRDLMTITKVIQTKKREVELRLNDAVFQLNTQAESQPDSSIAAKLRHAADILRSQIRRMDTQLDYVQTRKEIERLKLTPCKTQKEKEEAKKQIGSLINRMGRLHQTMKEANRQHLKSHLKDHQRGNDKNQDIEPKRKKKRSEDKSGLANIKSKITDLIKGNDSTARKQRKSRNSPTNQHKQTLPKVSQPSHEDFMQMLSADAELKDKVCSEINSFAGDNPVMRALTAEAQKRLGASHKIGRDVDERETNIEKLLSVAFTNVSNVEQPDVEMKEENSEAVEPSRKRTSSQSSDDEMKEHVEEPKFPFRNPDLINEKCCLPKMSCGLFVPGCQMDATDPTGLHWAMNEISRFLAKLETKCNIIGGPYIGRSSFSRLSGNSQRLAPFSSLSSLLFTECD